MIKINKRNSADIQSVIDTTDRQAEQPAPHLLPPPTHEEEPQDRSGDWKPGFAFRMEKPEPRLISAMEHGEEEKERIDGWEPGVAAHGKPGWFSPTYHQSRAVRLDQARVTANRCLAFAPDAPEMDSYRVLRTRIRQQTGRSGGVTILITSAFPEEGKTLTAINLSQAFAQDFRQTVLLIDCDLKKQQVCEKLGFDSDRGLMDHLLHEVPLSELTVWPGIEKFTMISGGGNSSSGSELLGSPQMQALVEDVRNRYHDRYVFLDGPSLLAGADALPLVPLVDYVLLVVRAGKTSMDDVAKAACLIPKEKMLGLVLNREKH